MTIRELVGLWEDQAHGLLTQETYDVHLTLADAAKIEALSEMYPRRTKEQLLSEIVSAALSELETSFPYKEGNKVVSVDEMGDPIYNDEGPTPAFQSLTKKHLDSLHSCNTQ